MNSEELKTRKRGFALRIIRLAESLPEAPAAKVIRNQLLRCRSSVGANYRAACRARSRADFVSKMGIVLEEADESLYWLEIIVETEIIKAKLLTPLMKENNELVAIFVASLTTAKKRDSRAED